MFPSFRHNLPSCRRKMNRFIFKTRELSCICSCVRLKSVLALLQLHNHQKLQTHLQKKEDKERVMVMPCPWSSQASFMSLESRSDQWQHMTYPPTPNAEPLPHQPSHVGDWLVRGLRGWWWLDGRQSGTLPSHASVLRRKRPRVRDWGERERERGR